MAHDDDHDHVHDENCDHEHGDDEFAEELDEFLGEFQELLGTDPEAAMELVESVDESFAAHPLIRIAHAHARLGDQRRCAALAASSRRWSPPSPIFRTRTTRWRTSMAS